MFDLPKTGMVLACTRIAGRWRQSYSDAIVRADLFHSLEQAADRVDSFQLTLLPGLTQTADYRRAKARYYKLELAGGQSIERQLKATWSDRSSCCPNGKHA